MKHLILTLEAPMMSFGAQMLDHLGPTDSFPRQAGITGLIGNALGYHRTHTRQLQALQDNLVFASRIERETANRLPETDLQTVQFDPTDGGWTTRGVPEGRTSSKRKLNSRHLRFRQFLTDAKVTLALRLNPNNQTPSIDDVAQALIRPAHPLFIGRKPFIPSTPILQGETEESTALQAVLTAPVENAQELPYRIRLRWPATEGHPLNPLVSITDEYHIGDLRNWQSHLYGGVRLVREGHAPPTIFHPQAA